MVKTATNFCEALELIKERLPAVSKLCPEWTLDASPSFPLVNRDRQGRFIKLQEDWSKSPDAVKIKFSRMGKIGFCLIDWEVFFETSSPYPILLAQVLAKQIEGCLFD